MDTQPNTEKQAVQDVAELDIEPERAPELAPEEGRAATMRALVDGLAQAAQAASPPEAALAAPVQMPAANATEPGGLTRGQKAAIAVVVGSAALLVLLLLVVWWRLSAADDRILVSIAKI